MAFKEDIRKKVPGYVQETPEFKVFLALVKKEYIRGPASLRKYLDAEIEALQKEMSTYGKSNPCGTMSRKIRPCAEKLDFLRIVKQKILKFL